METSFNTFTRAASLTVGEANARINQGAVDPDGAPRGSRGKERTINKLQATELLLAVTLHRFGLRPFDIRQVITQFLPDVLNRKVTFLAVPHDLRKCVAFDDTARAAEIMASNFGVRLVNCVLINSICGQLFPRG